jgi:SWI/SNF-related matrix-associated actin-dependent regulator of chromatin subfamily A-like protein 1
MIVDYTGKDFLLKVTAADELDMQALMVERGLDYSRPDSQGGTSVFYSKEPWGLADLWQYGTEAAKRELAPIGRKIEASKALSCSRNFKVPYDKELWPFQKASLEYLLDRTHGLDADEPGLGKTATAIAYANEINAKRVLVICPAALRLQWARRIREWSTMAGKYVVYPVISGRNGIHPAAEWTIISFSLARNPALVAAMSKIYYDLCIIDESHALKESESAQTRAIYGDAHGKYRWKKGQEPLPAVTTRCAAVLDLSGTPIVNRPLEAYTTSRALCWDAIDYLSLERFRERFNPQKQIMFSGGKRFTDEKIGRVKELGNRMRGMFMARHAKRDVMTQLKMPKYEVIQMEETGEVKKALQAESMLHLDIDTLATTNDYQVLGHIATVRKEMGVAIAPQAADYIALCLDGGEDKIVVFGHHIEVLDVLQAKLQRYGVLRIDGSTSPKRRQEYVDTFIRDPHMKVMLGNLQSMGTGVDGLQEVATHCILVEPSWTPGENQQAVDRLDRGGQQGHVQADFIVAPGSIAEKILVSALTKAQIINKVVG